jgi:uncharacterized protein
MTERVGDWLQTFTGVAFYPVDPRTEEVRIDDISAALSKLCRYSGHCIRFYSVAEHCVHVAAQAPEGLQLAALLHDASEAYLVDVPRPLKPQLTNYAEIEDRLMFVIAERFGFAWPMAPDIKAIDNRILMDERNQNMGKPPMPWVAYEQLEPLGVALQFWRPARAAYEFKTAFYRYGGKP